MKIISPCFPYNQSFMKPLVSTLNQHSPNIDLVIYGDNFKSVDFYYTKMERAAVALAELDDEIVVLADGFDVIVNKPLDGLEEEFKKFDCKLLISAEANCFPFKEYESFLAEKSNTILKFPCAGCWIGYREYMIQLFTSELAVKNAPLWRLQTDQGFMETIYYKSFFEDEFSVKIDTEGKIFVNTFLLEEGKHFVINDGQMKFIETGETPYFIHFNGDGKIHMPLFGVGYMQE